MTLFHFNTELSDISVVPDFTGSRVGHVVATDRLENRSDVSKTEPKNQKTKQTKTQHTTFITF